MRASILLLLATVCPLNLAVAAPPSYPSHEDLSFYVSEDGTQIPIRTPADWEQRRRHIIEGMEEIMGPLPRPAKPVPLDVEVVEEHQGDGFIRRKIAYHTDDPKKRVRAWLLIPTSKSTKRLPAMLCLQQTTKNGKDSPVGLADRPTLHYALELAKRGYVTLSPDYPSFGEYPYDFDADNYISGSMKAIYDNTRAIDVLASLPEVDPLRIGCIGHSLGGHNSLFTAVFDPRIKAVVTSCGFTSFRKNHGGNILNWSGPRYMPLILTKYKTPELMPFDFQEVLAAIAPRPILVVAPLHDSDFAVEGVRDVVAAVRQIYKLVGNAEGLVVKYPDSKHDFPDAERKQSYEFLDRVLRHKEIP